MQPFTWGLIVGCVILFFLYQQWKFSLFKSIGIPADTPLPLFGHFHKIMKQGFAAALQEMRQKHGTIYGVFLGTSPVIIIADADMLKEILVRNFSHFHNRRNSAFDNYPLNKAVSRLQGARWKHVRNIITPAFSANKMKLISVLNNRCCDNLIKHMGVLITTNPDIEVRGLYGNMILDTIAQSAFGLEIDSQDNPNSPFVEHAKDLLNINNANPRVLAVYLLPQLAPIFNYFNIGLFSYKAKQFFLDVTTQALNLRKGGKNKRVDVLQLLADAQENHDPSSDSGEIPELAGNKEKDGHAVMKKGLTKEELMAQAMTFFLAGYETTRIALSCLSYALATNPNLQEKLYKEIQQAASTSETLSYDAVNKIEYLEMFLNETLRLYPPGILADRMCTEDITINNIMFTKGTGLFYNIYSLHRDPKYWEDPEKFDPERFSKENVDKIYPFAFLPFGTGPRNCIGIRFALLVVKTTLARVVQKFRFEPCEKTQIPLKPGKRSVVPEEGITLRIVARE